MERRNERKWKSVEGKIDDEEMEEEEMELRSGESVEGRQKKKWREEMKVRRNKRNWKSVERKKMKKKKWRRKKMK